MPKVQYICKVCEKDFDSYNQNPQYCSIACKAEAQSVGIDAEAVDYMYRVLNKTQIEIAQELGTSQKVIFSLMKRYGINARIAKKRNQTGKANHNWKASKAGYKAMHLRVQSRRGKPQKCEECGTTDPTIAYDWATMNKRYDDPTDYRRLCRSCHWKLDGTIKNIKKMKKRYEDA